MTFTYQETTTYGNNMNKFEFISYTPTPTEKQLGIATVKIYGRIIARFKIVQTKDGLNSFPAAPSIKIGEQYFPAFMLDSSSEKEELDHFIKLNVKNAQAPKQPVYEQQSLFDPGTPPF